MVGEEQSRTRSETGSERLPQDEALSRKPQVVCAALGKDDQVAKRDKCFWVGCAVTSLTHTPCEKCQPSLPGEGKLRLSAERIKSSVQFSNLKTLTLS